MAKGLKDVEWQGNSKKMFDEMMETLPAMYRAAVKKKLEVEFKKLQYEIIKEKYVKKALEDYAPPKYRDMLMPIYEKYKTEE